MDSLSWTVNDFFVEYPFYVIAAGWLVEAEWIGLVRLIVAGEGAR